MDSVDIDQLWLATLQEVASRAAHEVKDALNGVSLNLEVIRSRSERGNADWGGMSGFAMAAAEQFELLAERTEALLFLWRPQRPASGTVDVAITLRHLAALLVPAAKSDGGFLAVEGPQSSVPTSASTVATRLALAAGLLALTKEGGPGRAPGGRCRLESGDEIVVRFSHEPASTFTLDPVIASALAEHSILSKRSGSDLLLTFPGHS